MAFQHCRGVAVDKAFGACVRNRSARLSYRRLKRGIRQPQRRVECSLVPGFSAEARWYDTVMNHPAPCGPGFLLPQRRSCRARTPRPPRRGSTPRSAGDAASYSRKIRCLYSAVNDRRFATRLSRHHSCNKYAMKDAGMNRRSAFRLLAPIAARVANTPFPEIDSSVWLSRSNP